MNVTVKIQGASDLAKTLATLPAKVSRSVQVKALREGAEVIQKRATALAPPRFDPPHIKDNIAIQTVTEARQERQGRQGETLVLVGPERRPDDVFYAYFQEYGTVHHRAQPFMRPAFDSGSGPALNRILSALWAGIRKALPQSVANIGGRNL